MQLAMQQEPRQGGTPFWARPAAGAPTPGTLGRLWRPDAVALPKRPRSAAARRPPAGGLAGARIHRGAATPKSAPPTTQAAPAPTAQERLRSAAEPPSHALPSRPAPGVAVLRRLPTPDAAAGLRPLKEATGADSPRPPCDSRGSPPPEAREPPYVAKATAPLATPTPVASGFDKLTHALGEVVTKLPDGDSLDHRWIRVGKWVDRYFVDQAPGVLLDRLQPVLSGASAETAGLGRPNLPVLSVSCALLRQALMLFSRMWPPFEGLVTQCFRNLVSAIFVADPHEAEREPPKLLLDGDDDELRRQILQYGSKTYFQALRELSRKHGQAATLFEQRERERGKLIDAMDGITSRWQAMFRGLLFRAWRSIKARREEEQESARKLQMVEEENKALQRRNARVHELIEEVRNEKNQEIWILRKAATEAEERAAEQVERSKALAEELRQCQEALERARQDAQEVVQAGRAKCRELDLRYTKLAEAAYSIVSERLPWPDWEYRRLLSWEPWLSQVEQGRASFSTLSATGDAETLLDWVNLMAERHSCYASHGVERMQWFSGGLNSCHVWACVLGVLGPSHVSAAHVGAVFEEPQLDVKARMLHRMLRVLHVPDLIEPGEFVRESSDVHHLLAVTLLNRFLQPDTSAVVHGAPCFGPAPRAEGEEAEPELLPSVELERPWAEAREAASDLYDAEHPMPDKVRSYLNMTAGALLGAFEAVQFPTRRWAGLARSALGSCLEGFAAGARYRSRHGEGLTRGELADRPLFTTLRRKHLKGAVDTEEQIEALCRTLQRNYRNLRLIFRHYGSSDPRSATGDLSHEEMWKLCTDCGLPCKGYFDRTSFRVIFSASNFEGATGKLVRIAQQRFSHRAADPAEAFALLIERFVVPEAAYSDASVFKSSLRDPLAMAVLRRRSSDMAKVFRHYASLEMAEKSNSISLKEFMRLMMDCRVVDEVCTHHALQQIFVKMQDEDDGAAGQMEMHFHEFVDAVCAVAAFKNPAPFLPVHIRIQRFWQNWVMPPLRQQLRLTDGVATEPSREPGAAHTA
eukprot:TRINITY_DN11741_c0_g1_i1.p1 TRINITY_DN11741_c0_g1~~TRINITY_DN11741_c0_g1_i1.p1  ORF type:complete len:1059 (+),score=355.31 TRINITY_DN11741_c0_g1_i1:69-3179(+)